MQMRDAVATLPDFVGRKYSKHPPGYGSVTDKTGIRNRETRASIGWLRMTHGYGYALYMCAHTRGRASLKNALSLNSFLSVTVRLSVTSLYPCGFRRLRIAKSSVTLAVYP